MHFFYAEVGWGWVIEQGSGLLAFQNAKEAFACDTKFLEEL